ncbi:PREDICTED: DC-STAMP domain-containing protein 1 [Nicrophorus vespilloides]|uniref:DC-STAMP domain-containing protein 1 n=1 Tax=Nicrophorus vespilloides TaxID=110193 RepID=A0ABM1MH77_NICVS|nr:PREDICTED: DC-STAMP domain-containing protein 1 [Nicrophorus vespilloides]
MKVLFHSKSYEHVKLKRTVGFFYGMLLGFMFYELILVDLDFTEFSSFVMGLIITLMLSFGIAFSTQIRCISMLAMPNFGGQAGRGVLKSLVFAYLLSGPVENLTINGKEVVRVFGCTTSLTFNLTKTRFELMFKPFSDALLQMKADANEIKDTIRSIRDVSAPIAGEIEGEEEMKKLKEENDYLDSTMEDSKRSKELDGKYRTEGEKSEARRFEANYLKKIEMRCQDQFTKASKKCKGMFGKGYDVCYDTVTWVAAWLLCWPMKITFICNIAEAVGGSGKCDPSKHIDPGFGEGYEYLKKSRATLSENFKNVKLQYKIGKIKQLADLRDATDTAKAVIHEVDGKKQTLDTILRICKRLLAFVFLRIIISSQKYHDRYLRDIEFDNLYITKYFKKIDARRKLQEKHTLLPLKKVERMKLIDPWSSRVIAVEKQQMLPQVLKMFLEMVTATTIILLDRLFYEALDLVRRHAKLDFYQAGSHDMLLQVKGTGMIARLLRSVVRGFNIKKRIKTIRSNATCLPQPNVLSNYYLYKIYGTYLFIMFFILIQAYTLRLRRPICSIFYRKREKRRVLFLYNQTLKRRIGFFRYMKKKVKKMAREQRLQQDLNVCAVLRIRFPKRCRWLRIFKVARRKCIICGEPEPRKISGIPGDFGKCKTPGCYVVHCLECWNDMGRECFACAESDSETEHEDSDEDHHDFD